MSSIETVWSLHPGAAHREVGGEFFVVTDDRAFHHIHVPTAVDLFAALRSGHRTAGQLSELLCGTYEVTPEQARRDVSEFLQLLAERQIAVAVPVEAADPG